MVLYLLDNDQKVINFVKPLLQESLHCEIRICESANHFIESYSAFNPSILLLDVNLNDMHDGLTLQQYLNDKKINIPVIFIAEDSDIPTSVAAIKAGALDFLEKPLAEHLLQERLFEAVVLAKENFKQASYQRVIESRFDSLTKREKEVMFMMTLPNERSLTKHIAYELSISARTVDKHRARILKKMQAKSLLQLTEMRKVCPKPPTRRPLQINPVTLPAYEEETAVI